MLLQTFSSVRCFSRRGFTLVELLTVLAVIGLLVGILIPTVTSARRSALKAKTRVQFNQWIASIESFRREYGFYPEFGASGLVNPGGQSTDATQLHVFHDVLAGRRRDGSALPVYATGSSSLAPEAQNRRLITFHTFSGQDFTAGNLIGDASGNTDIVILVDRNLDGVISISASGDYAALPACAGMTPLTEDFPATGLRTGVAFYGAAPNASTEAPAFVFSWK